MPKKAGIIFVMLGVVLVLSALLLFFYNSWEDHRAGQQAELLMDEIRIAITEKTEYPRKPVTESIIKPAAKPTEVDTEIEESQEILSAEMPTVMIDGYEYIGYVSIPDLELALPVMAEWDYSRLKIAPCRHLGSSRTDDLVIAGHNYETFFGSLYKLKSGAEVTFTDMDGIENHYVLMKDPETLAPDAVDAVLNSGYDLVLYTCTPNAEKRVVVFCDRVTEEIDGEE